MAGTKISLPKVEGNVQDDIYEVDTQMQVHVSNSGWAHTSVSVEHLCFNIDAGLLHPFLRKMAKVFSKEGVV